jgi:hypothetical protein
MRWWFVLACVTGCTHQGTDGFGGTGFFTEEAGCALEISPKIIQFGTFELPSSPSPQQFSVETPCGESAELVLLTVLDDPDGVFQFNITVENQTRAKVEVSILATKAGKWEAQLHIDNDFTGKSNVVQIFGESTTGNEES